MPIDPTALANLLLLRKPSVCAYWAVYWDPLDSGEDRYYSDACYHELPPFTSVGHDIEAQIVVGDQQTLASTVQFEINPDLRAEKINIEFNDLPARGDTVRPISSRFQTFKSGVRAELFFYFPDEDLTVSMWLGQLQAPDSYARKTIQTVVTNGFRSREQPIPRRPRPRECTANWGGWMPSTFASESNGCPAGPFGTIASADLDCPRDSTATCNTKLGTSDGKYFLGFNTDAAAVLTDPRGGYIAVSQGNQSALGQPIRVIAGQKYLNTVQPLLWRRERTQNNPTQSWVAAVYEVGEGPVQAIQNIRVNEKLIPFQHTGFPLLGELGQPRSPYASNVSNFSGTAHFMARYGWIDLTDPSTVTPDDINAECQVIGYNKVAVFTDDDPLTYTRTWTDNRVWWLMELYTNQRFGMAYPETRFEIADWIVAAAWANNTVSFTALFMDGESKVYSGHRTRFECALEARPVAEVIEDICRSGAISLPFIHESKFTVDVFRPATGGELSAARIFTDDGSTRNIIWGEGQPAITLTQVPDDKVINQIELTFEDSTNFDVERPLSVDDPNQKLKAGRTLGENNLHPVPKKYAAFGCRSEQEVARLAYRLLRFGEFDEGGTQNNLRATFTVPFVQALGVKRYDIIKIVSTLLDGFEIGTDDGVNDFVEEPQYFRVLRLRKTGGVVEITAQAYNQTAYEAFETVTSGGPPPTSVCTIDANCPDGYRCLNGVCVPIINPPPCLPTFGSVVYDPVTGTLEVPIEPCL